MRRGNKTKAASMLHQRWSNSFGNPFHTFPTSQLGELCQTMSISFQNQYFHIHTHFTLWLASCVEVRKETGFELLSLAFCSLQNYFCHFSCAEPFSMADGYSLRLQVAVRYKHLWFPMWSENTSYEMGLIQHNLAPRVCSHALSYKLTSASMPTLRMHAS